MVNGVAIVAARIIRNLKNRGIKTFTVAYGGGISGSGLNNFRNMAREGGTNDVIVANTTASLKPNLKQQFHKLLPLGFHSQHLQFLRQ